MRVTYSKHARERMAERRITEGEVEETLASYYVSYPDRDGNPNYISTIDSRRIRVVVAKDSDPPHVITVI